MRRMSANNHRGQEATNFDKQAGYMRAMIFSHINDRCLAKRSGSIYVGKGREQDAEALPTWMARIVPDNCFAFPPSMAVIVRGVSIRAGRP